MKCQVTSVGGRDIELSYRIKCVAVESERVFGDVTVKNERGIPELLPINWSKRQNLVIRQYSEGPNFLELNRRGDAGGGRRRSIATFRPFTHTADFKRDKFARSRSLEYPLTKPYPYQTNNLLSSICTDRSDVQKKRKVYPSPPITGTSMKQDIMVSSLVNQLLVDIYGSVSGIRSRSESESTNSSCRSRGYHKSHLQRTRLELKCISELRVLLATLREHINHTGGLLIRQLRRRDYLLTKRDKLYDVVTAHLQAHSKKRSEDTRMKFSLTPQPGESGFIQWLDAMKMVAKLQRGIPAEFRRKLWLTLAEKHLEQRGVDWREAEKLCFNEWSNPDDEELGIQIVKDLHRTGCSLFCGAAGRDNQAVLRRVLLGFARWNKSVGYCQGLNVLAALILQVVDRDEAAAVKVMIHLIEGVLPEGYFADSLKGLSVDMAVFRDLLRMRLPRLSKHLDSLQNNTKDKATGSSYEPPLTNVFTMQWFLTLFCHCLPQEAVLRVWDLIFLEGDDVLLRTALAIWEGLSDRIMTVTSADEFYSIMGVLTREMLEFTDTNNLVKTIVSMGALQGITNLREKHRYNITPWARRLSDDDDSDTEEDERLAVAAAAAIFTVPKNKKSDRSSLQTVAPTSDRERLALDISTLKQQYAKLRERQRQAHIILSAACARQSMVPTSSATQAMNHLLVGKNALVSNKNRTIGPPSNSLVARAKAATLHTSSRSQSRKERQHQGITIHWKDMKKRKDEREISEPAETSAVNAGAENLAEGALPGVTMTSANVMKWSSNVAGGGAAVDSDSDSTSTELCDEPDRLSDVDSEELTSTSDCYVMKRSLDEDKLLSSPGEPVKDAALEDQSSIGTSDHIEISMKETSIAEITDQIRRLSADDADFNMSLDDPQSDDDKKSLAADVCAVDDHIKEEKSRTPVLINDNYLDKGKQPNDSSLYNDSYLIEKKRLEIPESFGIDYSIDKNKSTILTLYDNGQLSEEKKSITSQSSDIAYSMEDNNSNADKKSTVLNVSDNNRHIEEKKLSTMYDVDYLIEEKTSIPGPKSLDYNIPTVDTDTQATVAKNSDYTYNFLETRNKADVNGTEYMKTAVTESKLNKSVYITAAPTPDNYSLGNAEIKYPTRSAYVIGHLPIAPMNFDKRRKNNSMPAELIISEEEADTIRNKLEQHIFQTGNMDASVLSSDTKFTIYKMQVESKCSPKTPESTNSFASGETMGPDSITSSAVISPKSPLHYESRDYVLTEKSMTSSVSSESKTLTMGSVEGEVARRQMEREASDDKSATPSTDSLLQIKSSDPPCSSTDSFCSSGKLKSSDRSFSSELQSPISANSIKYSSNYNYKYDGRDLQEPSSEIGSVISPFYPILNPNKKTPSPCGDGKNTANKDVTESNEFHDIVQSQDTKQYFETRTQAFDISQFKSTEENIRIKVSSGYDSSDDSLKQYSYAEFENYSPNKKNTSIKKEKKSTSVFETYHKKELEGELQDADTLSPLPSIQFDHCSNSFERARGCSLDAKIETLQISGKSHERSNSSLDKRFPDMLLSPSMEDFANNVKKRSSDVLEDLRHLEAKTMKDGEIDPNMLTKKSSFILEDLRSLEARRQDTFSNSASSFSRQKIDISGNNISTQARKTYVVEPKINIDDNSDSILKTVTYKSSTGNQDDEDDQTESKLGVWTKVKPRKRSDSGRRSSDRALKIIQENSAILQKILTCQARKRLPDLEEISKEITISPINEEISKIFSPILEKMGLNEEEINEELAKINFKDLDRNTTTTTASEFDAKINDELSKLSLIGDNDEVAYLPDVDDISSDYLVARDAFIDRQINEELSRLLANYEENSTTASFEKGTSSFNANDDLLTSSNMHSYKPSNDSVDIKSNHNFKESINSFTYSENPDSYVSHDNYIAPDDFSTKNSIDAYGQLHQISYSQPILTSSTILGHQDIISSSVPCMSNIVNSSKIEYSPSMIENQPSYNISPLNNLYNNTYNSSMLQARTYDYKSRISPRKTPSNPYSVRSYDPKNNIDTGFENSTFELTSRNTIAPMGLNYEYGSTKHILSKEHLEFQVTYNQNEEIKKSMSRNNDSVQLSSFQTKIGNGASYFFNNDTITPVVNYESNTDTKLPLISTIGTNNYGSAYQYRSYENVSPEKYSSYTENYNVPRQSYKTATLRSESQISSYPIDASVTNINRQSNIQNLSPHYRYGNYEKVTNSSYSTVSLGFDNSLATITTAAIITNTPTTVTTKGIPAISKTTYSNAFKDKTYGKSTLTLGICEENKQIIDNGTMYNFDGGSNPMTHGFSPFPSRNLSRKPKELALKLGLYSPTKSPQLNKS